MTEYADLRARLLTGDRDVACLDAIEAIDWLRGRVAELERGEILTDKELVGAVIECVMSTTQSHRDDNCRKLQRHILRVEEERNERETECERRAAENLALAARVKELAASLLSAIKEIEQLREAIQKTELAYFDLKTGARHDHR
jgi:septal ring factor EnvC (AmiA/AmiB activator)